MQTHKRGFTGSADRYESAASTSEARKRNGYARPGQVSFNARSLAMESFGRLGKKGSELFDHLAVSIAGGTGGGYMSREGVCKDRFFQIVSVTTRVAILRRVHRYKISLRCHQASRRKKEEVGGRNMPMAWG